MTGYGYRGKVEIEALILRRRKIASLLSDGSDRERSLQIGAAISKANLVIHRLYETELDGGQRVGQSEGQHRPLNRGLVGSWRRDHKLLSPRVSPGDARDTLYYGAEDIVDLVLVYDLHVVKKVPLSPGQTDPRRCRSSYRTAATGSTVTSGGDGTTERTFPLHPSFKDPGYRLGPIARSWDEKDRCGYTPPAIRVRAPETNARWLQR